MPFVVIEADVAATDISVRGSFPNFRPATALIPIWKPIVGFADMLGIIVIPDLLWSESGCLFGRKISLKRSPTSYCIRRLSAGAGARPETMRRESTFNESAGGATWA